MRTSRVAGFGRLTGRISGWALAIALGLWLAAPARAENYAILFSGGVDSENNWEVYYEEILRHYKDLVHTWDYKPENITILFADGQDPGKDLTMWVSDNENSDWSYPVSLHSPVFEASRDNTEYFLSLHNRLGPGDLFYWWSYDHGWGHEDVPGDHDEEKICGWHENIDDNEFADWTSDIGAGRQAYVVGGCFSGGIIEELDIGTGKGRFAAASSTHQEPSQSGEAFEGFNDAWCDAIDEVDHTNTHWLYNCAYEDTDYAEPGGADAPYEWMTQHPWMIGDDLCLAVAAWQGAGAGGTDAHAGDADNWSQALWYSDATHRIEVTEAATILVDSFCEGGYLTVSWDSSIGANASVLITSGGYLGCTTAQIGVVGGWPAYGYIVQNGGTADFDRYLVLGDTELATGRYDLFLGNLFVGAEGEFVIANEGVGILNQAGGNLDARDADVYVGRRAGGIGTCNLAGEFMAYSMDVGYEGHGTVNQSGGSVAIEGDLTIGSTATAEGFYNLSNGTLSADHVYVGYLVGAEGHVTVSGGVLTASSIELGIHWNQDSDEMATGELVVSDSGQVQAASLVVGAQGLGTVRQTGGSVFAASLIIGESRPTGAMNEYIHTGGLCTVTGNLFVGGLVGPGQGRYELRDTGTLTVGGFATVGSYGGSSAFDQYGGLAHVGSLGLGFEGGTGAYTMHVGAATPPELEVDNHVFLGSGSLSGPASTGTFVQQAGNHHIGGSLSVGQDTGSFGEYDLSTGALHVGGETRVGFSGTGTFTQAGGLHAVAGDLVIGYGLTGNGTYTLTGGLVDARDSTVRIGKDGTGVLNLDGGSVYADEVIVGSAGTFNFGGAQGLLRVNLLTNVSGNASWAGSLQIGHSGGSGSGHFERDLATQSLELGGTLTVGYDARGEFYQTGWSSDVTASDVVLGKETTGDGFYQLSASNAEFHGDNLTVGERGIGFFDHRKGAVALPSSGMDGAVVLGQQAGADGTYDLYANGSLDARTLTVGSAGTGEFNQYGGAVTLSSGATLGVADTGVGDYTMTGGTFSCGQLVVGADGQGAFVQSGAADVECTSLMLGTSDDGDGSYQVQGGTFAADDVWVGYATTGEFVQIGGQSTVAGTVTVSGSDVPGAVGDGRVSVNDGSFQAETIRVGYHGVGLFQQPGGSVTADTLYVGASSDGDGTYDMDNGTLDAGAVYIGSVDGGTGRFNYDGGTLHADPLLVNQNGTLALGTNLTHAGVLVLQAGGTISGTGRTLVLDGPGALFRMNGGTAAFQQLLCGVDNIGKVNQGGGDLTVAGALDIARNPGSTGEYKLRGGTLEAGFLTVGVGAPGTFLQTGGSADVSSLLNVYSGTCTLEGGDLSANQVRVGEFQDATLNLDGGALSFAGLDVYEHGTVQATCDWAVRGGVNVYDGLIAADGQTVSLGDGGAAGNLGADGGTVRAKTLRVGSGGDSTLVALDDAVVQLTDSLIVGDGATWEAYCFIRDTAQVSAPSEVVARVADASITQSGGTNSVANTLTLGQESGHTGTYNLQGGLLDGGTLQVGVAGGGNGYMDMTGGELAMNVVNVEAGSTFRSWVNWTCGGALNVNGGTVNFQNSWITYDGTPSVPASATIAGGLVNAFQEFVGQTGSATVTQSGGTHSVADLLQVGHPTGGQGTYDLDGGSLTAAKLRIGNGGTGAFHWNGGTLSANDVEISSGGTMTVAMDWNREWPIAVKGGALDLGAHRLTLDAAAGLTFEVTGGSVNAKYLNVGQTRRGAVDQNGGAVTVQNEIFLGTEAGAVGDYGLSSGGQLAAGTLHVGYAGASTFEHTAGAVAVSILDIGRQAIADGTYNMYAGSLSASAVYLGLLGGTGRLNYYGGTLDPDYVQIQAGGQLVLGQEWTTDADFDLVGGGIDTGTYTLTLQAGAQLSQFGGAFSGRLRNEGTFDYTAGDFTAGRLDNYGTFNLPASFAARGLGCYTATDIPNGYVLTLGDFGFTCGAAVSLAGEVTAGRALVGDGAASSLTQTAGRLETTGGVILGGGTAGTYVLEDGELVCDSLAVGRATAGTFRQMGGSTDVAGRLDVGTPYPYPDGKGTCSIAGGQLAVGELHIGTKQAGSFRITDPAATVTVGSVLELGPAGELVAVPGSQIHLTGSQFLNEGTNPAALAGLANLALLFEGGLGVADTFEVASTDRGASLTALADNFTLGTLNVGGTNLADVTLLDAFDNNLTGGPADETLYVHRLVVGPGSRLDLGGRTLYYLSAAIPASATVTGGTPQPIPIPGAAAAVTGAPTGFDVTVTLNQCTLGNYGTWGMLTDPAYGPPQALSCTAEVDSAEFAAALAASAAGYLTIEMYYDEDELAALGIAEETLRPYWYNVIGNGWVLGGTTTAGFIGESAFAGVDTDPLNFGLGYCGLDTLNDFVWVNANHASDYGVGGLTPEPAALSLLAVGAAAVLARRRRVC